MSPKNVSVIIPAGNMPQLSRTLESLLATANYNYINEIIVVGDNEYTYPSEKVKSIQTGQPCTAPVARNIGIRAATSEWLCFIDADCEAKPDWLEHLLSVAETGYLVVGGGVEFGRKLSYWANVHNVSMLHQFHSSLPSGPRRFLPTLNLLVHKLVAKRVGLMNEAFRRAQDLEWTVRMQDEGFVLWFEAAAVVTHAPNRTGASIWPDYFETGRSSYLVRTRSQDRHSIHHRFYWSILFRAISPLIAVAATARIFLTRRALLRYIATAPGVWFTKLAWCFGAADEADKN